MSSVVPKNANAKYYLTIAGWIVLQVVVWNIPPSGALTQAGVRTIAAFLGLIYGMCLMKEFALYTIVCVILMGFSGAHANVGAAFSAGAGGEIFTLMFFILLFSATIVSSGLMKNLATRMLNMKITAGRPWMLTFVIFLVSSVFSIFLNCMVVIVIVTDLVLAIYRKLDMKGNLWTCLVLFGANVLGTLAMNIMPFQLVVSSMYGMLGAFNPALTYQSVVIPHVIFHTSFLVLMFAFVFLMVYITCKNKVSDVRNYKPDAAIEPLNREMKFSLGILIGYVVIQIFTMILPMDSGAGIFFGKFGLTGYSALAACIALLIRWKDGTPFISFETLQKNGVNWFLFFILLALNATIGTMMSESTGIIAWITDIITPVAMSVSPWAAFAIILGAMCLLTNVLDNVPVAFASIPIIFAIGNLIGINPAGLLAMAICAVEVAFLLPSSCLNTAYIFGKEETGFVKKGSLIGFALPVMVFSMLLILTLGWALQGMFLAAM